MYYECDPTFFFLFFFGSHFSTQNVAYNRDKLLIINQVFGCDYKQDVLQNGTH